MFEAFVADLLASYLGFFLDVKREKLRISLWSGDPCLPLPNAWDAAPLPACSVTVRSALHHANEVREAEQDSQSCGGLQHGRPGSCWTTCG